jgi:DNA-binding MarR family transcriptional regulator
VRRDPLVDALVRVAFATTAALTSVGADNDLSLTQLRVLAILRGRRVRMTELAAHLGLEKSSLSGLVDRAEKRGLLQRASLEADRRVIEVVLSPSGAELADRLVGDVGRALAPMIGELGTADQRRLQQLLERMLGPQQTRSAH